MIVDISDLLGVPYREHGRTKEEGFDCYGLAIEVYRRMGYDLPDVIYSDHSIELVDENKALFPMTKTDVPCYGALLEMEHKGNLHIGVCLSSKDFIHTTDRGVRINRIGVIPVRGMYLWDR